MEMLKVVGAVVQLLGTIWIGWVMYNIYKELKRRGMI